MTAYETDEQQVEALKKWWRENGKSMISGVVIGLAIIVGWQGWQQHKKDSADAASLGFDAFRASLGRMDGAAAQGERLIQDYPDSIYASLTALALARYDVSKGDLDAAIRHLSLVVDSAPEAALSDLARSRLARVQLANGKAAEALRLLSGEAPAGFESIYAEIRGDVLLAKGDVDGARAAYDEALAALKDGSLYRADLQMKRDDLGE